MQGKGGRKKQTELEGIQITFGMVGWLNACGNVWKWARCGDGRAVDIDRRSLEDVKYPFGYPAHGTHHSQLIYYLLSLTYGVNVPCLANKNNLEKQLPQVKLLHFPGPSPAICLH